LSVKLVVVMVAGLIASLNVATTLLMGGTRVALLAGMVLNTVGAMVSTDHVKVAGVLSTFPAGSMALTLRVCDALVRPINAFGVAQALKAAPSRLQLKVTLASGDVNVKSAVVLVVRASGMVVMLVSGGVLSTVTIAAMDTAELFDVSTACAVMVVAPSSAVVEFQSKLYGTLVSVLTTLPLIKKSTWSTATSSAALAARVIVLPTLAPLIGAVRVTLGGVISGGVVTEADGLAAEKLSARSRARTAYW